jgi:hypothetical protein
MDVLAVLGNGSKSSSGRRRWRRRIRGWFLSNSSSDKPVPVGPEHPLPTFDDLGLQKLCSGKAEVGLCRRPTVFDTDVGCGDKDPDGSLPGHRGILFDKSLHKSGDNGPIVLTTLSTLQNLQSILLVHGAEGLPSDRRGRTPSCHVQMLMRSLMNEDADGVETAPWGVMNVGCVQLNGSRVGVLMCSTEMKIKWMSICCRTCRILATGGLVVLEGLATGHWDG